MTKVSITIDVENPQTPLFEKQFSDNRIWSDGNGIEKIIEILNKYGIKGSFFTNVYEYPIWGKSEMERIVKYIHDKGHDVELHTHPIWIDDKRRENMFQFTLREQEAIIQWGADFIETHTGRRPTCHRAGAYGFNNDTLIACKKAGLAVDSSHFFGHPNCKQIWCKNDITIRNGIVGFPVTYFQRDQSIIKTDIEWCSKEDIRTFLNTSTNDDCNHTFLNLFLHSYSLTKNIDNFRVFSSSEEKTSRFTEILDLLLGTESAEISSLDDLAAQFIRGENFNISTTDDAISVSLISKSRFLEIIKSVSNISSEPIALFINSIEGVELLSRFGTTDLPIQIVTLREEIYNQLIEKNIQTISPHNYGYHFVFHNLNYRDTAKFTGKRNYSQSSYQQVFDKVARNSIYNNKNIRYFEDYDMYINGDYNASAVSGQKCFYPIDIISTIITALSPAGVLSLDGNNDDLESSILKFFLKKNTTIKFGKIKLKAN